MKFTKEKTSWILLKADTNSEWDSVDFFLTQISDELISSFEYLQNLVKENSHKHDVNNISRSVDGYFLRENWDEEKSNEKLIELFDSKEWLDFINEDGNILYLDLENNETIEEFIELCDKPENNLKSISMSTGQSFIVFESYGEYTSEEFFTSIIAIDQLK